MAFRIQEIIDLKGILFLILLTIPSIASTNLDCYGKAFHCVNSTHFMICVDLGRGVSTTIDDFIIPCPATTVCRSTNRFECEFPVHTVLPPEISSIATTQTSESEVVTFNPLVVTSIPFEAYFNTVSTTTLSESDLQSSTDSVLPVNSVNIENIILNTSKSDTLNTNESISRDANVQPVSKVDNNSKSSVKSSNTNSSNVENVITSNLNIIPYDATTLNNTQEPTTNIDMESRVTDSFVLNTSWNNSQNVTSTDVISAINEQISFTTESFSKDFLEPLLNTSFSDSVPITPEILTVEVKDILNASRSENNVIVDGPVSLSNATTLYETTTNPIPGNDKAVTVIDDVNKDQFTIHDKLDTQHVTEQFTVTLPDIATTERTTSVSNDSYSEKPSKSTTTPDVTSEYSPTSSPDYGETNEHFRKVSEIINEMNSETNIITDSNTDQTETIKPTEAQINVISSNSGYPNVSNIIHVKMTTEPTIESIINELNTTEPIKEVKEFINAKKTQTNIITDSTTDPTDAGITMEATVNIVSNNSVDLNNFNKINVEVTTKSMREVKEIVNATELVSNIVIIQSSTGKTNASKTSETQVKIPIFSNNSVTRRNFNNSITENKTNITSYASTIATNIGSDQELFKDTTKQPETKSTTSGASNDLGNDTTINIDITTTTVASVIEIKDFPRPENVNNEDVNPVIITDSNTVKEIASTTIKNDLRALITSSFKVTKDLEFKKENIINDLQNDAENFDYDLNNLLGNTTDRIVLNEKDFFTNFKHNEESTQKHQPDVNETETKTIATTLPKNEPRSSIFEQTTTTWVAVDDKNDSANMNDGSYSKKTSPAENVAQTESVTLYTSPTLSSIAVNESDRANIDITNQINDSTRYKNDRYAFTGSLATDHQTGSLITQIPSTTTTMQNKPTDKSLAVSSIFKDYTDQVILPDQNKLVVAAAEIITLFPPTETVDLNQMSSTQDNEKSQVTFITMGTSTSFPTDIITTEVPYTTLDYRATKKTAGFPGKNIVNNKYDDISTTIDNQPTTSNVYVTTLDSSSVVETQGKNSLNKNKTKVLLPDVDNDSTVSNIFRTQKQILSAATTTKKENINSTNLLDEIAESVVSFNNSSNNLTEKYIIITSGTVYKHKPDTVTVNATELATHGNVSVDRVVEEVDGSTSRSLDVIDGNADTVKITQQPSIASTHNNITTKVEIQSQSERPISIAELNYDSVMTSSTIPTELLDNIKMENTSTFQPEISPSTDNLVETITRSTTKELHVEVNVGQGVNTDENNTHILSTNLSSDVSAETFTTPGLVLLDTTVKEDLRPTFNNQNIANTERTLFRSSESEIQVATAIPVISRTDSLAFIDNLPITQVYAPYNNFKPETNTLENNVLNLISLVAKNEESVGTITNTNLNTRPFTSEHKSLAETASFDTKINMSKPLITLSVENKENILPNQGLLDAKLHNESNNIPFSLNTQSPMQREQLETAASTIKYIPVTGLPNSIETYNRYNFDIEFNTQSQIPGDVNLGTTKSINNDITLTESPYASLIENEANHVPYLQIPHVTLDINNGGNRFEAEYNAHSSISGDKNLGTTMSYNNGINIITEFPDNLLLNDASNTASPEQPHMTSSFTTITNNKDLNVGTTKSTNNGITQTESPHASLIENEANDVPHKQILHSDINNASHGFDAGSNTQRIISGDNIFGTTTSYNNGILIITTENPGNLLVNKASNTPNLELPHVTSNSGTTNFTNNKDFNLGTTKSINNSITQTESSHAHASLIENEANDLPHQQTPHVTSNMNNASYRFDDRSNTQSIISGDKNLETTTSYNNSIIIITGFPNNLLVNEASSTPNPDLPDLTSNSITTSITNNKENIIVVTTTSNNDLIEEPRGLVVVSTTSSSSIERVTYPIQKTTTNSDNILTSINFNTESLFVTKTVENVKIELPQTNPSGAQTFEDSSDHKKDNNISNVARPIQVPAIKSSNGNVQQSRGKSLSESLSVTPQDIEIANEAIRKPFGVTVPIDLDNSLKKINATTDFDVANMAKSQTIRNVDSRTIINQLTYVTSTTPTIIGNKQESITSQATQSHENPMKTSEYTEDDVTSTGLATNLMEKKLVITTENFPVFTKSMNTDIDIKLSRAVTPAAGLRPKTEVNNINTITGSVNITPEMTSPSVEQKQSVENDGFRDNTEQIIYETAFSASSDSLSVGDELSTGTDVLVDNMESGKTHSGIISLITQPPTHHEPKEIKETSENNVKEMPENLVLANNEHKEKPENNGNEVKDRSEILMLADEELILLSVKTLSTPSINLLPKSSKMNNSTDSNNNSTKEELLIKTESNKSTTDIDGAGSSSIKLNAGKLNENGSKISASEIKKETPTHEIFEISTALANDSHISNNKSKVLNKNTFDAHNTTVISNDQSSTPRFMSQAKSTAVGDKQTEFPAFESTTLRANPNKFTCNNKIRGRYADEVDCRKFYICLGTSQVVEGTCPNNTVFSEIRKQCTNNLSHCIRNKQFRCVTEGHFSDFLNDNVYYICVKNNVSSFIRFKLMCQNGYHLNKTSVRCKLNKISTESTSTSDSSKNNSDQSVSSTKLEQKAKTAKKFKCKKEGNFADRSDCRRYFECTKTDTNVYRQKRKKCDSEEIFHKDKKRCVDDDSYECN